MVDKFWVAECRGTVDLEEERDGDAAPADTAIAKPAQDYSGMRRVSVAARTPGAMLCEICACAALAAAAGARAW